MQCHCHLEPHSALPLHSTETLPARPHPIQRGDLLHDAGRTAHRDRPRFDILAHDTARANGASLADRDARQNDRAAADPTIVPDDDFAREFDVLATRTHFRLVRCGEDGHVGPEHHAVPDQDEAAVEDHGAVL